MNIKLKHLVMHNFMSFGDADIDLSSRGYVLVSGVNLNPNDSAKSNGSGKSSWGDAILYAITGETVRGTKDVVNINSDGGCFVELDFEVNGILYQVIRYKSYEKIGTNLKLYINGEDKSGKGIRDTEKLLSEYLPDLTASLIGSVMILGQGLPERFTSNSPSGRKDVLEKLAKSDFMIDDIKARISNRKQALQESIRKMDDSILVTETKINSYRDEIEANERELESLNNKPDYDFLISDLKLKLNDLNVARNEKEYDIQKTTNESQEYNDKLGKAYSDKASAKEKVDNEYVPKINDMTCKHNELKAEYVSLSNEITRLESITDICPTCGQKIPNKVKPDTTSQRERVSKIKDDDSKVLKEIDALKSIYNQVLQEEMNIYTQTINNIQNYCVGCKNKITQLNSELRTINSSINETSFNIAKYENECASYEMRVKSVGDKITSLKNSINELESNLVYYRKENDNLHCHQDIVNKMFSIATRDFRGYLLTNVISFIDKTAKHYCMEVFGNDNIAFTLDGNNINIEFNEKAYENLSGGEKQKIDIIIQFAIRDMLMTFTNFSSNVLILDEITDNLDSYGCQKILDLLSRELTDVDSVFIISHHSNELAIPYDSEMIIEKNEQGISRVL